MREQQTLSPPCWLLSKLFRRRDVRLGSPPDLTAPAPPRSAADLSPYSPLPAICSRRESASSARQEPSPDLVEAEEVVPPPAQEEVEAEGPQPPPLLRQKTYVVAEPLVVKGPAAKKTHKRRRKLDKSKAWNGQQNAVSGQAKGGMFFVVGADDSENSAPPDENRGKSDAETTFWCQY